MYLDQQFFSRTKLQAYNEFNLGSQSQFLMPGTIKSGNTAISYQATEQIRRVAVDEQIYTDTTSQAGKSTFLKELDSELDQRDLYSNKNLSDAIRERLFSEEPHQDINQFDKV